MNNVLMRLGGIEVSKNLLNEKLDFFSKYLPEFDTYEIDEKDEHTLIYSGTHPEFDEINILLDEIPQYRFTWERAQDDSTIRLPVERL